MMSIKWIRGIVMAAVVGGFAFAASRGVKTAQAAEASDAQSHRAAGESVTLQTKVQPSRSEAAAKAPRSQEEKRPVLELPKKPIPYTQPGEPPATLRRLTAAEVPVPMRAGLHQLLRDHRDAKVGALIPTTFEGKAYVARVEIHYHPEGGPVRPWGNHRGISLFVERE